MEECISGEIEGKMIRPTAWKLLLGIIPFDKPISEWVKIVNKQRSEWKNKMKNLNTLKKFAGDPLGGNSDVNYIFYYLFLFYFIQTDYLINIFIDANI